MLYVAACWRSFSLSRISGKAGPNTEAPAAQALEPGLAFLR